MPLYLTETSSSVKYPNTSGVVRRIGTAADRLIDVDYEEIKNDPFAVMEPVYALAGQQLNDAGRTAWQLGHGDD